MSNRIENHVRIVAMLNIMIGVLHLMIAGLMAYNLYGVETISENPGMAKGLIVVLGIGSLPYVLVGIALFLRMRLALPVAMGLGALILFEFPVGTPLGIYAIWLFGFKDTESYFNAKNPKLEVYSESD
ncbi:MAG: hypothetical protein VCD00_10875 [Candidatus Hydrogenedentota bacterium]